MLNLTFPRGDLNVLCLGAHCDDIEIGCGGTILRLLSEFPQVRFYWCVLASNPLRAKEAQASAEAFLAGAQVSNIVIRDFRDGFLPFTPVEVKEFFEQLKQEFVPDLILTHYRDDRHQDHRFVSDLTWNTWRNHWILEYEIPKYDGDIGQPNVFVPLSEEICHRKAQLTFDLFPSQQSKPWFTRDLFLSLMRLRGMESNAPSHFAEAFYARKMVL
jgi:LmbE family N-acetylglucosaminyl deacetylase